MTDQPNQDQAGTDASDPLPSRAREEAFVIPAGHAFPTGPAIAVRFATIDSLIPYIRNARTHSDAQVAQIAASIAEFGFTNPVLADEKGIVAGHGRVLAARQLYAAGKTISLPSGLPAPLGTVPVVDVSGWSDEKRRAYILADNVLAERAGWNSDLLKLELTELQGLDFNLDLIGFDAKALGDLLAAPDEIEDSADDEGAADDGRVIHCPSCGHDFSVLKEMKARRRRRAA